MAIGSKRGCSRRLLVAHAEGVLGLVHHGLVVLVRVGGARGLVSGSLTGRLLVIRNDVALGLVGGGGDTLLDLVGCGLALLRRDLLLNLVTQTLAAVVSHVDGVVVDCCVGGCVMCLEESVQMLSIAVLKKDVDPM